VRPSAAARIAARGARIACLPEESEVQLGEGQMSTTVRLQAGNWLASLEELAALMQGGIE
jgi:hypothetical protein